MEQDKFDELDKELFHSAVQNCKEIRKAMEIILDRRLTEKESDKLRQYARALAVHQVAQELGLNVKEELKNIRRRNES